MAETVPPRQRYANAVAEDGTFDPGLSAAEYAAIHLRVTSEHVPEWLNAMVRERQRMDAELAALTGHLANTEIGQEQAPYIDRLTRQQAAALLTPTEGAEADE